MIGENPMWFGVLSQVLRIWDNAICNVLLFKNPSKLYKVSSYNRYKRSYFTPVKWPYKLKQPGVIYKAIYKPTYNFSPPKFQMFFAAYEKKLVTLRPDDRIYDSKPRMF